MTTERTGAKVMDGTKLYLVSSVTRGTSPTLHHGRLKHKVGEETSFPTNTAFVLCMALGRVPRQPTGRVVSAE